ncbi:thioredoxin domain-containing protein [Caulobacter sp. SLTY]|uniref:DsbA family protein n=1 Tax=Caulobacter sp. SLTY TaxID=2683262 RepID=UPI001411C6D3|nr:DsbA family protein [Caulobacter sp. SLTY]NBB17266.1 thioredoxin domain-containing protein [Caulobacter sp. SLTY]
MGLFNRRAVIGATLAISALALAACGGKTAAPAEGDMTLGSPTAKVKMVEYGSLSCVHCANWNKTVFPEFKKKYIDTGKIQYTFRPFKLGANDSYTAAADLLGRCVGKDKYFAVIDALFHAQEEALTSSPLPVLLRVGVEAGLTEAQVKKCITDEKALVALDARLKNPQAKEVQYTPTFWIGDQKFETSLPIEDIDKAYAEASK